MEPPAELGRRRVDIAIVPAPAAQTVTEVPVKAGVRAILKYAPIAVKVDDSIHVRDIDPVLALQSMTFYLKKDQPAPITRSIAHLGLTGGSLQAYLPADPRGPCMGEVRMTATVPGVMECPHCHSAVPPARFCRVCRRLVADPTGTVEFVTYNRRFWGDDILESVLVLVTLVIGWFIWLIFTARTGQTPAKRLLNVYIIDTDSGTLAAAGKVWFRDVLIKLIIIPIANFFVGVVGLVDAGWVFFDRDRQSLHDKMASTIVVYAPAGIPAELQAGVVAASPGYLPPSAATSGVGTEAGSGWVATETPEGAGGSSAAADVATRLRELARLHEDGILNDEEYEQKRADLVSRL